MKTARAYRHRIVYRLLGMAVLAAAPPTALAAWRTWVGDDTALGGSGTWNSTNLNWSASDAGTAPYYAWASGDNGKFSGTGGVVNVEGTVTCPSLYFLATGYVIANGTNLLTGNTLGINLSDGATATISTVLSTSYSGCTIKRNRIDGDGGTLILDSVFPEVNSGVGSFGAFYVYQGTTIMTGDNYYPGWIGQNDTNQFGVIIHNGTLHNAGSHTIRQGGTLGGTGTVQLANSSKFIDQCGTLTPGTATEIGTLTVAVGDLKFSATAQAKFQVDLTADKADKVVVGDLLTYNGTLTIDVTGERKSDASYALFQFGSKTGTLSAVNITGVNPNKAEASFDANTGVFTYHVLPPKGTVVVIQ